MPRPIEERTRRNLEQLRRAVAVTIPATSPARIPDSPTKLTAAQRRLYEELWSSPVSRLWLESDAAVVARLAVLRDRIARTKEAPAALFAAATTLEDHLILAHALGATRG